MVAPSSDFENLQSVYMRTYNRLVNQTFRENIPDDDFSTPESQMKLACTIKDNDTAPIMLLRMNLFYFVREEAKALHPPLYTMPIPDWESVEYRPQVILSFRESRSDAHRHNRQPKQVRASFRLMNERANTITQADVTALENRIKLQFPRTYLLKTGRLKMSYRDKAHGIELITPPYSQAIGRGFITKVLAVAGLEPDWEKLSVSETPNRNYTRDDYIQVLGERKKLPKRRSVAEVYLKRAVMKLHGSLEDITLYETY